MTAHLVTGGTGYVGRQLVKALLDKGDSVSVVVRSGRMPAVERAREIFPDVCAVYDSERFGVLDGDVTRPGLALQPGDVETLTRWGDLQVWHLAANVSFKDSDRIAVLLTNVQGTRNVVQFANRYATRLVHVSTAFVCGDARGEFCEEDVDVGQRFRNGYEESKYLAERVVREECHVPFVVFRPSVIVGGDACQPAHSKNAALGYYRFAYLFCLFKRNLIRALQSGSAITRLTLRVMGTRYEPSTDILHVPWLWLPYPEPGTVDLVHLDDVVRAMVGIGTSDTVSGSTLHLTEPEPHTFGALMQTMLDDLGILDVNYAPLPLPWFRTVFKALPYALKPYRAHLKAVLNYLPYINQDLRFTTTNAKMHGTLCPGHITRGALRNINREAAEAMFTTIDARSRRHRPTGGRFIQHRWSET